MPVAGSLSGMPSSVITTCSRRAPRSDSPVSPRAVRRLVYGMSASSPFTVDAPAMRASAVVSVALVRPAVRTVPDVSPDAVTRSGASRWAARSAFVASSGSSGTQRVSPSRRMAPADGAPADGAPADGAPADGAPTTARDVYPARATCTLSVRLTRTNAHARSSQRAMMGVAGPVETVGRTVSLTPINGARVRASVTQTVVASRGGWFSCAIRLTSRSAAMLTTTDDHECDRCRAAGATPARPRRDRGSRRAAIRTRARESLHA